MPTRVNTTLAIIVALIICIALIFVRLIESPTPKKSPSSQSATSSSNTISTSSVELAVFRSNTFPLTFQYPKGWIVDDTMGGVTVTSYKSDVGASIGTVPGAIANFW